MRQMRRQKVGRALVSCPGVPGSGSQEEIMRSALINIETDGRSEPLSRPLQFLTDRQGKCLVGAAPNQKQGRQGAHRL
jgi:hypothetical protein